MIFELQSLQREALAALESAKDAAELDAWRIRFLSRQGALPRLLEGLKEIAKEDRPAVGKVANEVKSSLQNAFEARLENLTLQPATEPDPTLPGRPVPVGSIHPLSQTLDRMTAIFKRMGFVLADGPLIETEFHNFDALNTPADHPARNEQDTFYLDLPPHPRYGKHLLRTHTSTMQIRWMEKSRPPVQIIAPGRCFRRDEIDATHMMSFHQFEGLVVAPGISIAHMKGVFEAFFRELIGPSVGVRFRPHFFPFTEPSFEVDFAVESQDLKGRRWLEIAGCGMVDPAVFEAVGIDPEVNTGFAFGMGVDRIAMVLHQIPDIRLLYENDLRLLQQFRVVA